MSFFFHTSRFPGSARKLVMLPAVLALTAFGTTAAYAASSDTVGRTALPQIQRALPVGATDAGILPGSQAVPSIIIELKRTTAQQSDLDSFLAAVQTSGSSSYHHWMTPADFAARFAPTDTVVAPVKAWLATHGLTVQSVSAGGMRLTVSGTAQQASTAFGIQLHRLAMPSGDGVLVNGTPSVPLGLASIIRAVSGLEATPGATDGLVSLAASVDGNAAAVVTADLTTTGSLEELNDILEQASAQGQSVLALHADPAALPARALSLVIAGGAATTPSARNVTPRPSWQVATGLPSDDLRATPDAAVATDATALTAALQSIVAKAGVRQGEVAATFYKLAPMASVFSHADGTPVGTWSAMDGLGTVNPDGLIKAWPDGATVPLSQVLTLSSQVVTHGANLTFTVTISGGSGTPTGTVTLSSTQGGTLTSVTLNSSGVGTYTTNTLAGGVYNFSGTYNGDSTYASSTTNVTTATVNPEAATVTGSVPTTAVGVGALIPVTVTVSAPSGIGTPSGTVMVYPFGTNISTQTFTGTLTASATANTATATVNVPATNAGTFSFQASCTTSASFSCYIPASVSVTEAKGTPVVKLVVTPGGTVASTTLTATVTAAAGASTSAAVPTGTIQFMNGTTALGSPVTLVNGSATYTGPLTAATSSIRATLAATSAAVTTTTASALISTTTSLSSSSGYTGPFGTSFTLISTVTPASYVASGAVPTGTITITDATSGTTVGTGTLASGSATITVSTLAVGARTLIATYSGDTNYAGSSSTAPVVITISPVTATVAATVSPSGSIPYGYNATLSVTVTLAAGTTPPSGTVTATISGNNGTYTGTLQGQTGSAIGTASISFPVPPPGTYTITVTCNTNVTCPSTTAKVTSVKGFTTTTLSLTPTSPHAGTPVVATATVANSGTGTGTYTYSGTVSFYSGGRFLGSGTLGAGVATASVVLTSTAAQTITAVYSGDTNWNGSTSAGTVVTPTPLDAVISLSANTTSGVVGQNVILTAALTSSISTTALIPTGTVTFYDTINGTVLLLGSAPLLSNTVNTSYATFSTTGLVAGTHNITAVYSGDSVFNKETSSPLTVNIGDFTLSFIPSTLQISAGGTGTTTVVVSSINNFAGSVALGCTPPGNSQTTCTVTPSVVMVGGTAQLTVTTTANKTSSRVTAQRFPGSPTVLAGLGGLFVLCFARGRRRRVAALLVLMLGVLLMSGGCGLGQVDSTNNSSGGTGTASGGTTTNGTPLGTYTFTVVGASVNAAVNARHNFNFSVTVQ